MVSIIDFGAVGDGQDSHAATNTTAIQAALNSGASEILVPAGDFVINATLFVPDNILMVGEGYTASRIRLSNSAANGTDVVHLGQWVTVRDLWFSGNWDKSTSGQAGIGIYARNPIGWLHGLTLENVQVDLCKSNGLYVYEAAYMRWTNIVSDTHGLNACFLEGSSAGSFTSAEITGRSRFSDCPNGYGIYLKNCHSSRFSIISENTKGIAFEGNHRAIAFDSCYFENNPGNVLPYVFNVINGGMIGLTISNCFIGMPVSQSVVQDDPNFLSGLLLNNLNASTRPYLNSLGDERWTVVDAGLLKRGGQHTVATQQTTASSSGSTETNLWSVTVPANLLSTDGQRLTLKIWGKTNNNANGKNLRVYLGASQIFATGPVAANNRDWLCDVTILRENAANARVAARAIYNDTPLINCATPSAAFGSDLTIRVTGQGGATGDLLLQGAILELDGRELAPF